MVDLVLIMFVVLFIGIICALFSWAISKSNRDEKGNVKDEEEEKIYVGFQIFGGICIGISLFILLPIQVYLNNKQERVTVNVSST